jgi:hypothetical protein
MNRERIQAAIAMMKRAIARYFDMTTWQNKPHGRIIQIIAQTESELHGCGNTACFAGHLALSPEFQKAGGLVSKTGAPIFNGLLEASAVAEYFDIPYELARDLTLPDRDFYPVDFKDVKPEHVIEKLEMILDGYYEQQESKP